MDFGVHLPVIDFANQRFSLKRFRVTCKPPERVLPEIHVPMLQRPVEQIRERVFIGSPEVCGEKLAAYKTAGVQRVFIWPVANELEQLTLFQKKSGTPG
jgi:alkanesulfonate monooxygenase SsuD/methylene tetrahydromethanopterin reductase-like flavin-dependent oxidoreductase (luciferase family)